MKKFVIDTIEVMAWVMTILLILVGGVLGYESKLGSYGIDEAIGTILGALAGFMVAVVIFGILFILIDIAENTRRTAALLEKTGLGQVRS